MSNLSALNQCCYLDEHGAYTSITSSIILSSSFLIYLASATLILLLKLHKKLLYRLILYLILISSAITLLLFVYLGLRCSWPFDLQYNCRLFFAVVISMTMARLMFILFLTVHLFALVSFYRNLNKLEPLYVSFTLVLFLSLVVLSLAVARSEKQSVIVGTFVGTIAAVIQLALCFMLVYSGVALGCRACKEHRKGANGSLTAMNKHHKRLMYEMMPLVLYPVIIIVATIAAIMVGNIVLGISLLCFSMALSLVLHVLCVFGVSMRKKMSALKQHKTNHNHDASELQQTANETSQIISTNGNTHYSAPIEE